MVWDGVRAASRATPLVLLVDDQHDSVDQFTGALGDGFNVTYAFDADTAFEIARVALPDVVVIDSRLPGEDAWTLIERLKASESRAPVIVLSSDASSEVRERAEKAGCAAFVMKPCVSADLAAVIRQVL